MNIFLDRANLDLSYVFEKVSWSRVPIVMFGGLSAADCRWRQ
jgi:hypothetical protein